MPKIRRFSPDGHVEDFRAHPLYAAVLTGTASIWLACIEELRRAGGPAPGVEAAYERAVWVLAQLPQEVDDLDARFDRSRWRSADVVPDVDTTNYYCEHPWHKKRTKGIVYGVATHALDHGVSRPEIIQAIADILDARQDTVLLPHAPVRGEGILHESRGDGLAERYVGVAELGTLIDRRTGQPVTLEQLRGEALRVQNQIVEAATRVGSPIPDPEASARRRRKARRRLPGVATRPMSDSTEELRRIVAMLQAIVPSLVATEAGNGRWSLARPGHPGGGLQAHPSIPDSKLWFNVENLEDWRETLSAAGVVCPPRTVSVLVIPVPWGAALAPASQEAIIGGWRRKRRQ